MGGATADLDNARIGADFIDDVNAELRPNRVALVAEIEEEWATPVDTRMEALDGTVFRRALSEVTDTVNKEEARRHEGRPCPTEGRAQQSSRR